MSLSSEFKFDTLFRAHRLFKCRRFIIHEKDSPISLRQNKNIYAAQIKKNEIFLWLVDDKSRCAFPTKRHILNV